MYDFLSEKKNRTLFSYPFIKEYFDGVLSKEDFLRDLDRFKTDLLNSGISEDDLKKIREYNLSTATFLEKLNRLVASGCIELIEKRKVNQSRTLKSRVSGRKLCVCDFYVENCEQGNAAPFGFVYDDIIVIDHHAPVEQMKTHLTTTELAIKYVHKHGSLDEQYKVVINHTDTDSILSSLIIYGLLKPERRFIDAAISADHTGKENRIADVLQCVEDGRNIKLSATKLCNLLKSNQTDDTTKKLLLERKKDREQIKTLISEGKFDYYGPVAYVLLNKKIDGVLVPALLPKKIKVIILAIPMPTGSPRKWLLKIRLGITAKGIFLNELDLPQFGGRWNAGGTERAGGTDIEPEEYAKIINKKLIEKRESLLFSEA